MKKWNPVNNEYEEYSMPKHGVLLCKKNGVEE